MGAQTLTKKIGLTHNMKNLVLKHNMDISRTFPQSFDLTDLDCEEFKDFQEDFKFTFVIAYLKTVLKSDEKFTKLNFNKVMICLALIERRVYILSGRFLLE